MIIGLVGKARHGKGEAASTLEHEFGFAIRPMTARLKAMMRALGIDEAHITGTRKEDPIPDLFGLTGRRLMQTLGTEWARAQHPDFWIALWKRDIGLLRHVVADDVRYLNEAQAIRGVGGTLIRVVRPGFSIGSGSTHPTETEQDSIVADIEIVNDGTLEDLRAKVIGAVVDLVA